MIITLHMSSAAEHLKEAIHFENRAPLLPIFDTERPMRATGDMLPWYTGRACEHVNHFQINMAYSIVDGKQAKPLSSIAARSWLRGVENDRLGSEITYLFRGIIREFRPDYLVRLANRKMLVLELKGQDNQEQQTKREF
jgi:type III restriction enzyme